MEVDYDPVSKGEWGEGRGLTPCKICNTSRGNESDMEVKREVPSNFYFPGSQGSLLLNEHLRVYFIARKLLKLSDQQFFHWVRQNGDGISGGLWGYLSGITGPEFCARCEIIVNEAVDLHCKVLDLQGQIDVLGDRLKQFWNEGHCSIQEEFLAIATAVRSNCITEDDKEPRSKRTRTTTTTTTTTTRRSTRQVNYNNEDSDSDYVPDAADDFENASDEDFVVDNMEDEMDEDEIGLITAGGDDNEVLSEQEDGDVNYSEPDDSNETVEIEDAAVAVATSTTSTTTTTVIDPTTIKSRIQKNDGDQAVAPKFDFQCTECSMVFSVRSSLHIHTRKVHGFEVQYACPQCPHLKFSRLGLREHRRKIHDKETTCYKCGKKLCSKRSLNQHFRLVHKMKVTFNCSLCPKKFPKMSQLTTHKKREHVISKEILSKLPQRDPETEEERSWAANPCEYCGKMFLSGNSFMNHIVEFHERRLSKEERTYDKKIRCYFCHKTFLLDQARWVHVKRDHPEIPIPLEFPCEICSSEEAKIIFQSTSELESHLETTHLTEDTEIHKCPKCGWPFMDEETLKNHHEVHIRRAPDPNDPDSIKGQYPFKCWFCWEKYPTEEARHKHLTTTRRHRLTKIEFPCDLESCEHHAQPFKHTNELNIHLANCHGGESVIRKCPECSWGFLSSDKLSFHKLNHLHRKRGYLKCPECEHTWRSLATLRNHYNSSHGLNLEIHHCTYCPLRFTNLRSLSSHTHMMHQDKVLESIASSSSALSCDQCGRLLKDERKLAQHQYLQHAPKKCEVCDLEFPTKGKWYTHWKNNHKVVDPEKQALCPHCGKVCRDKSELKIHIAVHGEKKFACHLCGKKVLTNGLLQNHIRKAHEEKAKKEPPPPPKFPCNLCEKGYARKDSLDDHVRREHTMDTHRVWSCAKCGKRFTRKGYLLQHEGGRGCSERWSK